MFAFLRYSCLSILISIVVLGGLAFGQVVAPNTNVSDNEEQPLALRLYTLNSELDSVKQDLEDISGFLKEWRPFYRNTSNRLSVDETYLNEFEKLNLEFQSLPTSYTDDSAKKNYFEKIDSTFRGLKFNFDDSDFSFLSFESARNQKFEFSDELQSFADNRFIEREKLLSIGVLLTQFRDSSKNTRTKLIENSKKCNDFFELSTDNENFVTDFSAKLPPCRAAMAEISKEYKPLVDLATAESTKIKVILDDVNKSIEAIKASLDKRIIELNGKLFRLQQVDAIESNKVIDGSAITVISNTLIAWGVIIVMVIIAIITLTWFKFKYAGSHTESSEFSFTLFLEMMTVFLLTGAILILGLASKIDNQGLAALIGGISGYVLGRMRSGKESDDGAGRSLRSPTAQNAVGQQAN